MIRILHVVGARPNFMKIAPIMGEMAKYPNHFQQVLVHTGQHYDNEMSKVFFEDLNIPRPNVYLRVGSSSHAQQTARIMMTFEPLLLEYQPDLVVVVGDVNSTLAATIVVAKLHVPVAHIEAGLRSFDRTMPEEINRIVTDALSTYLFTSFQDASDNLRREGIVEDRIYFVGNVMIDTLYHCLEIAQRSSILNRLGIKGEKYALLTLHRPSNVDNPKSLDEILEALDAIQEKLPIFFPIHPRTAKRIEEFGFQIKMDQMSNMRIIPPLGYIDFLALESRATLVLTDSGGIQEETTVLGIPCLTLRENTERPITVEQGTNQIVGHNKKKIIEAVLNILDGKIPQGRIPELWDGHAAERIVSVLKGV